MDSYLNKTIGDFEIHREIGRGGMGVVYEAEQKSLRRRVALKILPPAVALDPEAVERFEREAVNAAKLHHPNVVPVYSVGSELGNHYFAMEYIEGKSLAQIVSEVRKLRDASTSKSHSVLHSREREDGFLDVLLPGLLKETDNRSSPVTNRHTDETRENLPPTGAGETPDAAGVELAETEVVPSVETRDSDRASGTTTALTEGEASRTIRETGNHVSGARGLRWWRAIANLIASVADALQYAHEEGVIHRDIKPSNIMLSSSGRPLILDFGLSLDIADMQMTATGAFLGTPLYMSPEQAIGRVTIDHRTDIYSLGISLYELATHSVPFRGSREEIIKQIMFKDPPVPRRLYRAIPTDLQTIIFKALEKDPDRRYQTAGALSEDLRRFVDGRSILARPASLAGLLWRQAMRQKKRMAIIATIVVSLGIGLGGLTLYQLKRYELADIRGERQLDQQTLQEREREIALLEQQESREKLLQELGHDDPDKRSKAAKALGEMEDRKARAGLEAAANDTDAAVREQVILALGSLGDRRSLKIVTTALDDSNPTVRVAAVVALRSLQQPSALADLIKTLRRTSPSEADKMAFRSAIRESAGQVHTSELVELWKEGLIDHDTLLRVVDSSAVPEIAKWVVQGTTSQRTEACRLLVDIGDGRAAEALLSGLEHNASDQLKGACAEALEKIAAAEHVPALVRELGRAARGSVWDPLDRALAAVPNQALVAITSELDGADQRSLIMLCKPVQRMCDRPAVGCLVRMLEIDGESGTRSYLSYGALRGVTDMHDATVLPLLIELAESPERLIRQQVMLAIGRFTDPRVPGVLMTALDDPEVDVQVNAVDSLGYQRHRPALKKLVELSEHPAARVCSSVVRTLGRLHEADAILPLLKDREPSVRAEAASALGILRHEAAVLTLITAMKDTSPLVRQKAASALGRIAHTVAIGPLVESLEDVDEGVVREAAAALALIGDRTAIRPLVQAAHRTADAEKTGKSVVLALGRFRSAAVEVIVQDLSSIDSADRKQAVQLLGQLGHRSAVAALRPLIRDKASEVRAAAAKALGQLGNPVAAADILELLGDVRKPVRRAALRALVSLPIAKAPSEIVEIAQDPEDQLNYLATYAVGRFQDSGTVPALRKLATSDDARVRRQAFIALACLRQPEAAKMIDSELDTSNRDQRIRFVQALAVLGTDEAAKMLARVAQHDQPYVIKSALDVLGSSANDTAYQRLRSSLKHTRIEIRQAAASALAKQPQGRGVADLAAALQDTAPDVISSVDSALQILTDPDAPSLEAELLQGLKSEDANVRAVCATRLSAYRSPRVVEALVEALDDTYYWVRVTAAFSLGYLGDPSAIPPLRALTADSNASIRSAAVASLGRLGDDDSLESLLRALDDPSNYVRRNAALGIAFLNVKGNAEVVSALIKSLGDAYSDVRAQAAFALGEVGGLAATTELERLVLDANPDVAKTAVKALVEAAGGECPPVLLNVIQSGPPDVVLALLTQASRMENPDLIPRIEKLLEETSTLRGMAVMTLAWIHQQQKTEITQELATAMDERLLILRRRLTLDPDNAAMLNELAWLLAAARRDLDDALACARRAAYLSPTAVYLDTLAEVHCVRGELAEALIVLRRPELLYSTTISPSFNRRRIEELQQRLVPTPSAN